MKPKQNIAIAPKNTKHEPCTFGHTLIILALFLLCGCPRAAKAQTPVTLSPTARQQFFAADGTPLASGCLFTYNAGTSTPAATYTDSTGTFLAANPIILDGGGFATIWTASQSYRFVLVSFGGTNCATGAQQWVIDNINPPPFLAGNNVWTGTQTFQGATVFSGAANLNAGGGLSGGFSGSPTFTGNPTFSGTPIFSGAASFTSVPIFSAGIGVDTISGVNAGTSMSMNGVANETIFLFPGAGSGSNTGGALSVQAGNGGPGGGSGGNFQAVAGSALFGNNLGGDVLLTTGGGSGTQRGGRFIALAGNGGATAGPGGPISISAGAGGVGGNGGDITLTPGAAGAGGAAGSFLLARGRMIYSTEDVPTGCSSTGLNTGSCAVDSKASDSDGMIVLSPAGAPAATGTATVTFSHAMGTASSSCTATLNNSGSSAWLGLSTAYVASSTTSSFSVLWLNTSVVPAATALTAATTYLISYHCVGRN